MEVDVYFVIKNWDKIDICISVSINIKWNLLIEIYCYEQRWKELGDKVVDFLDLGFFNRDNIQFGFEFFE